MQCPRCVGVGGRGESAYRGGSQHGSVVHLTPEPMEAAMAWLRRYEHFWSGSLDKLAALVEQED